MVVSLVKGWMPICNVFVAVTFGFCNCIEKYGIVVFNVSEKRVFADLSVVLAKWLHV